jgi:hypothetical protein
MFDYHQRVPKNRNLHLAFGPYTIAAVLHPLAVVVGLRIHIVGHDSATFVRRPLVVASNEDVADIGHWVHT